MKTRFAMELLWFRFGKIGGGVSVVVNLLEGMMQSKEDFDVYLIIMKDQEKALSRYLADKRFHVIALEGDSSDRKKTVWLQNVQLPKILKENGLSVCLEPDNYMPLLKRGKIRYVTVIHDLQALHFPSNFSRMKRLWLKVNWRNVMRHSEKIIAISDFTKQDIIEHYQVPEERITTVYDPIHIDLQQVADFSAIREKYPLQEHQYLYTVGYLGLNKNLNVLIDMMRILKERGAHKKLVVSGLKGDVAEAAFNRLAEEKGVREDVMLTGFVENRIRNTLYRYCEIFLFPSVFEGFGMPPIEAYTFGARVITTRRTSLPEVTQNQLEYVNDPYDPEEWADCVMSEAVPGKGIDLSVYAPRKIAEEYLAVIADMK